MIDRPSAARRAYRIGRKRVKRASSHVLLWALRLRNRFTRESALGASEVVVSLTSYGSRLRTVAYAIESIASGSARPRRLILWLDDEAAYARRPRALRRLEARGLEVRVTVNYGPHTKYFPTLGDALRDHLALVTADDDILYPRSWLSRLLSAAAVEAEAVSCYRAAVATPAGDRLAPYNSWPRCTDDRPSLAHLATGVSGVYYPRQMLHALAERGTDFQRWSPKADDIWLHWVALRAGVAVRQISRVPRHFPYIPGTQATSLVAQNVGQAANDVPIRALYEKRDVARIAEAVGRLTGGSGTG